MERDDALAAAVDLYAQNLGNLPVIAERLSTVTSLTRRKAKKMLAEAVVEYIADLMLDYGYED